MHLETFWNNMKTLFCIVSILLVSFTSGRTQTYYYALTKQSVRGKVSTNVSGGQFITFVDDFCYESDRNGKAVGHGSLKRVKAVSGFKSFVGKSYWDSESTFKFKEDFSAYNVILANGDVYVYKRTIAPSSQHTCSLINRRKEQHVGNSGGTFSNPTIGGGGYGNNIGGSNNNSSNSTTTGPNGKGVEKVWHDCPLCNGKGRVPHESNAGRFGLSNDYKVYCSECGREFWKSTGHTHVTCRQCKGKRGYYTER